MVVGILRIELFIPAGQSLKSKRQVLRSIKDRVRSRFNVSVAEIEAENLWQRAVLGVAHVGDDHRQVNRILNKVVTLIENCHQTDVIDYRIEIL